MRLLLVLLTACAVSVHAQPSAIDSANVERVLDAAMLETSLVSFKQAAGPAAAVLPIDEYLTIETLRDSARAVFYADLRPELLQAAVSFFETPAYLNSVAAMQAKQSDPAYVATLMEQLQSGTGARADSSLVVRYLEATLAYESMSEAQTQMYTALMDSLPPMREAYTSMASASGMTVDSMLTSMQVQMEIGLTEGARIGLADTAEDDIEAAIAFYETPAGPYFHRTVSEGVQRAMIPAMIRMMRDAIGESNSQDVGHEVEAVDTPPELIGGLDELLGRVVYPEDARRDGTEGRVIVQFVVDERGEVSDAECTLDPDPRLCAAAVQAIASSSFTPGLHEGRPVRVRFALPVRFALNDAEPVGPAGRGADVYETVDTPPQMIGGMQALSRAFRYPEAARAEGVEGKVFVQFVVSETGEVLDPICMENPDPRLCTSAIQAVSQQRFSPGIKNRQPVKVLYTVPVNFVLR